MGPVVRLPELLPNQIPIRDSASSRKVLRCGRRFGKSRFAMVAGIDGHGPVDENGVRKFPGVLQGGDVVWVAQDYPNLSTVMWREEFVPRFKHLPFVSMNANEHVIAFHGLGTLFLRPETAIGGIRGIGKNLKGVILDEAAWYDLESALQDVIMPALLDNEGWLLLMSTTNAGPDGNTEKRVPSYFNMICEEIRRGERGPEWQEFTGTAFDNPRLSQRAIEELVAEYPHESPKLKQEVYAELLVAGVGVALEQVCAEKHLIPRFSIPLHWRHFGAFDWGFNHPYAFGWFTIDEDGNVYLVDTVWGRGEQPDEIAAKVRATVPIERLDYIVAGHDIEQDHRARGQNTPTLQEQFYALGLTMVKANIARKAGLNNMRLYVQWRATEHTPERPPRFRLFDTPGNRWALRTLEAMQVNPKDLEDALKVDASQGTDRLGYPVGGDDCYDMIRYGLASRPFAALPVPPDRTPKPGQDPYVYLTPDDASTGFLTQLPAGF